MDSEEFTVEVYDKALEGPEFLGDLEVLTVTPRHCQQPTGAIRVRGDHRLVGALSAAGARTVIRHHDEFLMSGVVSQVRSQGVGPSRSFTFEILDDFRILVDLLGWQVPGSAITAQSGAEYDTRTGPAETVLKAFLTANLARISAALPYPVTVATDLGRGDTITVQSRMHSLADQLFPVVDQAGIGVTVRQTLTGLTVDCYEPTDWPLTLSEDGGTLVGNDWTLTPPTTTRVVVGFDGDGTARVYRQQVNTAAEAAYGIVRERFVDARDLKSTDPNFTALAAARGAEALAQGAATAGLAIKLAETDTFRYGGNGVHVGDRLVAEIAPGTTVTDVLRSATLTWSPANGATVTPVIGDRDDDPTTTLVRAVSTVARTQRNQLAGG